MDIFWKLVILAVSLATVWGVVLGWSHQAVFFMDANDLMLSFFGWMALVGGIFLGMFLNWPWLSYVGAWIAAYFAYDAINRAHLHNNGVWSLSLPVGIAKVVLSFIYIASWVEVLGPGGRAVAQRRENRATAMIVIGLLTLLFTKLVNGEDVLARRGQASTIE